MTTRVFHRSLREAYPVAISGSGLRLVDASGVGYIDGSGGAAVSCLGHGHPDVIAALHAQIDALPYAHTAFFTSSVAEELADHLVGNAPAGMTTAYFVSGGSEAVEAALKLARQYHVERGDVERRVFIGRRQSYHGNTLGALAVGGNVSRRAIYEPLLKDAIHVSACSDYRGRRDGEDDETYCTRLAQELDAAIEEAGPRSIAAFIAETVVGATAGVVPPTPGYFRKIRDVCDRHGILLILDEVMCGMGRTGTLHACEQEGISPDILCVAKGLGGGYAPIGAMLVAGHVSEAIRQGSGAFVHGHTYNGHPLGCAAALAVQRVIERDDLLENVRAQGAHLRLRLRERFAGSRVVGDIRGRGLFQAIEFVEDQERKAPFPARFKLHSRIKAEARDRGLLIYPSGGTVDGVLGDHVLIAPPFIISSEEVGGLVDRLGDAVDAAVRGLPEMRVQ